MCSAQHDAGSDADAGDAGASDAGMEGDAADPAEPDPLDEPPTAQEEEAAQTALGPDEGDPLADEAERRGQAEGPAPSGHPTVATEIAGLTGRACLRALVRARIPFHRVRESVPGVRTPVRVTGPIRGVAYHSRNGSAVHELMDCRLAVSLARFSSLLARHHVVEVRHFSMYRVPSPGTLRRSPYQTRHPGGLAIDAGVFVRSEGGNLDVLRDFHGRRRRPVCGPEARVASDPRARALRSIVCDAARAGYFHVLLTPNFNRPHRNHFHLEVTPEVTWQFLR